MTSPPHILYCHCAYAQVLPPEARTAVLRELCASGASFEAVADLCELSARKDPALKSLANRAALKIAACYPRAIQWLFAAANAPLDGRRVEVLNLRTRSAEEIVAAVRRPDLTPNQPADLPTSTLPYSTKDAEKGDLADAAHGSVSLQTQTSLRVILYEGEGSGPCGAEERFAAVKALLETGYSVTRLTGTERIPSDPAGPLVVLGGDLPISMTQVDSAACQIRRLETLNAAGVVAAVEEARSEMASALPGQWKPWFPVIDYSRCTNCMQCLSFCLFGVYGVDARQRIEVQSAESCKTNCPACSRVCPEAAIIFPKYKSGPINGDAVNDAEVAREKMKIDVSALLGGDVYSLLRERSGRSQSRFSKERDANQALQERRKCLAKLAQAADIPPEVLMALPSAEEIQRRAEEAKARALAAQKNPTQ